MEVPDQVRNIRRYIDNRGGMFSTISQTPGWVWVVIGGVVLLVLGLMAASHYRHPMDEV